MSVNENNLARLMTAEAGRGGYHLSFDRGQTLISGERWLCIFPTAEVPRKVLAAIVEHIGYIPQSETLTIYKTKDGFEVQAELPDTICAAEFTGGSGCRAKNTGVSLWGASLWAGQEGQLRAVSPSLLGLIEAGEIQLTDTDTLSVQEYDGSVYIKTNGGDSCTEEKELLIWQALKKLDWWKFDTERAAGGEQLEM